MSRVFLAEDTALGRKVVVKVLPPEMSAELTSDRFAREVRVAASLQHPHLVPVLSAGAAAGVVYYVMPWIDGDSLAGRLAHSGALPVDEVVRILRDVTDALAYAHAHGVVHRDIKPANILLSGRHALVTDFGVAKALTAAAGEGSTLTGTGLALGTPAYMAPEQAAADPQLDHRADIYALGVVAYEMLAGRPPFAAPTAQAMLAAHVALTPESVDRYRSGLPPALVALVMRALEKHPADRWQDAETILGQLDAIRPFTPASTTAIPRVAVPAAAGRGRGGVLGLFLLATAVITAIAFATARAADLPDWVWLATLAAMLAGLPIILYTMRLEHRRAALRSTGAHPAAEDRGHRSLFTWRRAIAGGVSALGVVALLSGAWVVSRKLGIGPAATLLSAGTLDKADRLILADFDNRTTDKSIGDAVTEAFRVDLGQSRVARLLDARQVSAGLQRMGARTDTVLTERRARDLALREGAKAVVAGDITRLGRGYVLTARIITADSGATLAPVRVSADDESHLIAAVNRLSADLRARIGESLRSIRATEPLEQVTTASLPALRLYSDGTRAFNAGDAPGARKLLERAVELDTAFAMAWRKLAALYFNIGEAGQLGQDASRRAFEHRDRLPPLERYLTEGSYYMLRSDGRTKSIAAFRQAVDVEPDNSTAINNLTLVLNRNGQHAEAEAVARPAMGPRATISLANNFVDALMAQGKWAAIDTVIRQASRMVPPTHPGLINIEVNAALAARRPERADSVLRLVEPRKGGALPSGPVTWGRISVDETWGRFAHARALAAEVEDTLLAGGDRHPAAILAITPVFHAIYSGQPDRARHLLETVLAGPAFRGIDPAGMPLQELAVLYAALGDPVGVRRVHAMPAARAAGLWLFSDSLHWAALEAQAERRWGAAAAAFSQITTINHCFPCSAFYAGQMWDAANQPDSAITYY